jgi:DNA-binding NarL/FixJ family response regulator
VRLLICDDQRLIRADVRHRLAYVPWIEVVGEAFDGEMAVSMAMELRPNIILMDLSMPGLGGLEATRQIVAALPDVRILAFSADADAQTINNALAAGVHGFLEKSSGPMLLLALQKLCDGERFIGHDSGSTPGDSPPQ